MSNLHSHLIIASDQERAEELEVEIRLMKKVLARSRRRDELVALVEKIQARPGVKYLGTGCHRHVFLLASGKFVVKAPRTLAGIRANRREAEQYKKNRAGRGRVIVPPCRMLGTLLIMEAVDTRDEVVEAHPFFGKAWKSWMRHIDCEQVGVTRRGELVAYDFGGNP